MPRTGTSRALTVTALLLGAVAARAQRAPDAPPATSANADTSANTNVEAPIDDARDGIFLPVGTRSVRVLRGSEPIRERPDATSPQRGTAAGGANLPALEVTSGPGCAVHWVHVGRAAWICGEAVDFSSDPPTERSGPATAQGEVVPYRYAFAAFAGVRTYRRIEDVEMDGWAEELEQGMGVAVDQSARHAGRVYVHTTSDRWIAQGDLSWARPSEREGAHYEAGESANAVGFARRRVNTFATPEGAAGVRGNTPSGMLLARQPVHIRETQSLRGRMVVRTDEGWVAQSALRVPIAASTPDGLAPGERWVDVDIRRQTLVAYEGERPVYTTLVSTGRGDNPTTRGTFRVWIKLATATMSNADDPNLDTATAVFSLERVPWVMYFHHNEALHGVYWHDAFGSVHSHGCVNLAPRDAHWLFDWAPPALPPGWEAVFPSASEPGLRVRVR